MLLLLKAAQTSEEVAMYRYAETLSASIAAERKTRIEWSYDRKRLDFLFILTPAEQAAGAPRMRGQSNTSRAGEILRAAREQRSEAMARLSHRWAHRALGRHRLHRG